MKKKILFKIMNLFLIGILTFFLNPTINQIEITFLCHVVCLKFDAFLLGQIALTGYPETK